MPTAAGRRALEGRRLPRKQKFAEVAADMFAAVMLMMIWRCDVMRRGSCYRKIRAPLVTIQDYARAGGE